MCVGGGCCGCIGSTVVLFLEVVVVLKRTVVEVDDAQCLGGC